MPLVFTREEIREYLEEIGYGHLNDEDLSRFVKDLKRLIKMESQKRRRQRLGHTGNTPPFTGNSSNDTSSHTNIENTLTPINRPSNHPTNFTTSESSSDTPRLLFIPKSKRKRMPFSDTSDSRNTDSFSTPFSTTTTTTTTNSSGQDTSPDKGFTTQDSGTTIEPTIHISIPFKELNSNRAPVHRPPPHPVQTTAVDGGPSIRQKYTSIDQREQRDSCRLNGEHHVQENVISEQGSCSSSLVDINFNKSDDSLSDTDLLQLMEHILKGDIDLASSEAGSADSKKKVEIPMKIRRDPVALYHWYKSFWDRQKAPGEDRHMQLRWNVRAGTVGKYPCDADGVKINYLPLNPIKHKKKGCAF